MWEVGVGVPELGGVEWGESQQEVVGDGVPGLGGVRRARARARAPNKGFARRPQEFLAWGE